MYNLTTPTNPSMSLQTPFKSFACKYARASERD